ncbi:terpene synthase family protein [Micromonospora sp. M12]
MATRWRWPPSRAGSVPSPRRANVTWPSAPPRTPICSRRDRSTRRCSATSRWPSHSGALVRHHPVARHEPGGAVGFAVDWLVDHEARTRAEIDGLTARCLAVAEGGKPADDDSLGRFLAELRDELAAVPAYEIHGAVWRDELRTVLDAMAREWDWKQTASGEALPTLDEYLANAANLACTVVNVVHWLNSDDPATLAHLDALVAASDQVQRIIRLVNDLASYERDKRWGT